MHGSQESGSEFFIREDGELVDTLLVGLGFISIVSFNFSKVFVEDESSVGFFLGSPVDSVLGFPLFEGVSLWFR